MSRRAWAYVGGVLVAGLAVLVGALLDYTAGPMLPLSSWIFLCLLILSTVAQLATVEAPGHTLYYATPIFWFAGMLVLPPALFLLTVLIPLIAEWAKERLIKSNNLRAWYLQPFNAAMYSVAGFSAAIIFQRLSGGLDPLDPHMAVAAIAAGATYITLNHMLLGLALVLARGMTWKQSGALNAGNILAEFVLLCQGYLFVVLWAIHPLLVIVAIAPLGVIYRALKVPMLQKEAQTDPKTGLLNARYFGRRYADEFDRAERFHRPLAFIMADLDLLRAINNTYGHLAGDVVLKGVAQIISRTARQYDIAARFGGEEFALVLPETSLAEAQAFAERLRREVEQAEFVVSTSETPIKVTISIGIACYPDDATKAAELNHRADVAVYQAKIQGRNRVIAVAELPQSVALAGPAHEGDAPEYVIGASLSRPAPAGDPPAAPAPSSPAPSAPEKPAAPAATRSVDTTQVMRYVAAVIGAGGLVAALGWRDTGQLSLLGLLLIAGLAILAELLQVDLYEKGTISVGVALLFAAGMIGGMPALVAVSAASVFGVALAVRWRSGRWLEPHKLLFNWSAHVIAGAAPALLFHWLALPLELGAIGSLMLPALAGWLAYYLLETGLIAGAISLSTGQPLRAVWEDNYRWLATHYLMLCGMGLLLAIAYVALGLSGLVVYTLPIFALRFAQKQYVERTEQSMRELRRLNRELTNANKEIVAASQAIERLGDEMFETLARFFDARDPFVGNHAATVARYATAIARELGLPPERVKVVRQAAFLHDVGKIAIPESILNKPGKLSEEEYAGLKLHTVIGAELLAHSGCLRHLAPYVRFHHERWDGAGYPTGLAGEQIPLESRILNLCDSVEAMASDRPYKSAMSYEQVLGEVRRSAGTQFDPQIAQAFLQVVEREGPRFVVNSAEEVLGRSAGPGQAPAEELLALPRLPRFA